MQHQHTTKQRTRIPGTATDRFWANVDKNGPIPEYAPELGNCHVWTGYISPAGYGSLYAERKRINAHRYAVMIDGGTIPQGYEVDHLCRNPACVRRSHLEAVPPDVNVRRAHEAKRRIELAEKQKYSPLDLRSLAATPTEMRWECKGCYERFVYTFGNEGVPGSGEYPRVTLRRGLCEKCYRQAPLGESCWFCSLPANACRCQ